MTRSSATGEGQAAPASQPSTRAIAPASTPSIWTPAANRAPVPKSAAPASTDRTTSSGVPAAATPAALPLPVSRQRRPVILASVRCEHHRLLPGTTDRPAPGGAGRTGRASAAGYGVTSSLSPTACEASNGGAALLMTRACGSRMSPCLPAVAAPGTVNVKVRRPGLGQLASP